MGSAPILRTRGTWFPSYCGAGCVAAAVVEATEVFNRGAECEVMTAGPVDEPGSNSQIGSDAQREDVADCRTCELRHRCISWGWMSPGGIWFENAVILAPKPGCRGFVGRGGDIRAHFIGETSGVTEH